MLNNVTISRIRKMKLSVMADSFAAQLEDKNFAAMSFDERMGLIVEIFLRFDNLLQKP